MTAYTIPLIALPFVLAVWVLDSYVCIVIARILLEPFTTTPPSNVQRAIRTIADSIPRIVDEQLTRRFPNRNPLAAWVCVVSIVFLLRNLLVAIVRLE